MSTSTQSLQTRRPRRGANNFGALVKKVAEDAEFRAKIINFPSTIFLHDYNGPSVRARRAMVKREFLSLMRSLLVAEKVLLSDCSDGDIERHCFHKDRIIDYGCYYLAAVGSDESTNRGKISERFQIGALRERADGLWWFIVWFLLEDAGVVYPAWKLKSETTMRKVAVDSSLGMLKHPKEYFGPSELWLLLSTILSGTDASWLKQHYALWAMVTVTGARPGSLALNNAYKGLPHFIKWRDVRFFRIEGRRGIFLQITLCWLKGQRDPHHMHANNFKGATFVVYPCRSKVNLCADLTWILTQLAMDRGLFGERTLEDLETSGDFEIEQDPAIADHPIFLAGREGKSGVSDGEIKPLMSSSLNPVLQRIARLSCLGVRATIYAFRREFITTVGRNTTVEIAKELATHKFDSSAYGRYDYGMGDMNISEIRFSEADYAKSGAARNELRKTLSGPAILKLNTPFDEEACKAHIRIHGKADQSIIDFDDTLRSIIDMFCTKFELAKPKPAIMIKDLLVLAGISSVAGRSQSSDTVALLPSSIQDPAEWQQVATRIEHAVHAATLLTEFLRARKNNRAFVYAYIRREFITEWENSRQIPSMKEVQKRKDLSLNPVILQDPTTSAGLQNRANLPVHVEAWKTANKSMRTGKSSKRPKSTFEEVEAGSAHDSTQFADVAPQWDGIAGAYDPLAEEASENPEEDVLDTLEDGAKVVVAVPGDEPADGDLPVDEDEATEYSKARALIIRRWNDCLEVPKGKMLCPLCLAHPFASEEVWFTGAFKNDRHICAPTGVHNPNAGKGALVEVYAKSCREGSGKFACRLCKKEGVVERSYVEYSKLSKHLRKDHNGFCQRLCK